VGRCPPRSYRPLRPQEPSSRRVRTMRPESMPVPTDRDAGDGRYGAWLSAHRETSGPGRHGETVVRVIAVKPHHFVDIIADYGIGQVASEPNDYHNDVPGVTAAVLGDPGVMLRIESGADDICKPCVHNVNGLCDDTCRVSAKVGQKGVLG